MRLLTFALSVFLSAGIYAQSGEFKHQISFGTDFNFGWGGSASTADTEDDIDDYSMFDNNFNLTYLYGMSPRFQLGANFASENNSLDIEYDNGADSEVTSSKSAFYILANYNFHDDLKNAWYAGVGLGKEFYESDVGGSDTEYDLDAMQVFAGKRFNLDAYGLSNLTYAPSIAFVGASVNGDLEDDGVNTITSFRWNFIKFDLLW